MKDFKILFVHGYTASSQADFYPPLSRELGELGIDYIIPDLPGGDYPHAQAWLETIHKSIQQNTKPLIIVGHSLGTRAALLYIEKYNVKVEKLFLIAAFANRVENAKRKNGAYADFFAQTVDTTKLKTHIGQSYILHSKDDSSIPFEQGEEIAKELKAELIVSENRDHFSEPTNAPYILSILREKIGF
jgi:predicted alpha/beta hydrolase family esterase